MLKLSKREMGCLYFILKGKSTKIITGHPCVSRRTIEDYMIKLKIKFSVKNKYKLILNATQNNHLNVAQNRSPKISNVFRSTLTEIIAKLWINDHFLCSFNPL